MPAIKYDLPSVSSHRAVMSAYAALDSIQGLPRAEQVAGAAVLFTAMCDRLALDPSQLIDASRRRLKDDDNFVRVEVRALYEYISKELSA